MTPILLGGTLYVVLYLGAWLDAQFTEWLAILFMTAVRLGAIRFGWSFPDWLTYRPRK